jgi:uncharacterized protein
MTPQEQQLVTDLFDRLASLEDQRRDPDAERLIREGLGRAPNSVYALVQSVLVQDEALKRANARIEELERAVAGKADTQAQQGGFLDSMRNMISGRDSRGSVPSVRPSGQGSSGVWGTGPQPAAPAQTYPQPGYPQPGYPQGYQPGYVPGGMMGGGLGGGSFLGTAAATVAGVVGGAMLLNGIRGMMGGHQGFGDYAPMEPSHAASPWGGGENVDHGGGSSGGSGDLARDAGIDDIGRDHRAGANDDPGRASFLGGSGDDGDDQSGSQPTDDYDDGGGDGGGDFGGDFGGDDQA